MADLYPHQIDGMTRAVQVMQETGGYYLNWDPGQGKTLGAIGIARILKAKRILVLGPVVSLGVWEREVQKWWPGAYAMVLRDDAWSRSIPSVQLPLFVITNYDQTIVRITKSEKEVIEKKWPGDSKDAQRKRHKATLALEKLKLETKLAPLKAWGPDLLILDEAHYCKNPAADRSKVAREFSQIARYTLAMSGTPAHSPLDWWSQFNMVAPHEPMWSQKWGDYKNAIAVFGGLTGAWVVGFRPDVKSRALMAMEPYMDVATWESCREKYPNEPRYVLPKPIVTEVPIELSKLERKHYKQMCDELVVEIEGEEKMTAQIVLTKVLRLQQITSGHLEKHKVESSKLKACVELIEQRPEQKIMVACRFEWELEQLERGMIARKRPFLSITGATSMDKRSAIEKQFQNEDYPFVLLAQYRAGGMSLTLTAMEALIFYSLEHSYIAYEQMMGRWERIGLKHPVQLLYLLANQTVDWEIYHGIQKKATDQDMAKLLVSALKRRG
jgi:SNF2 family DNA or RNA helicase